MEGNSRCEDCGSTEFDVVDSYLKNKIICKNCRIIYQVDSDNGTLTPTGEEYNKQVVVDEERLDDHDTSMQTEERNIGEARMGLGTRRPKIIKDRKSRIIMKDGYLIKEQAEKIIELVGAKEVCLGTTAPVCSKTKLFLERTNIDVFSLDKI